MQKPSVIFFGSFLDHSAHVLRMLYESELLEIIGVVTTPPKPAGRKKELKPTHVHQYAQDNNLPVFTPEKLNHESLDHLLSAISHKPTLVCVAGYGKLLPQEWLNFPTVAPINIHFSLLPKYRGAMPGEWAMFLGESETGVSLIEMSSKLDAGNIIAQAKHQIRDEDTRESLYKELYDLGADLFLQTLEAYLSYKLQATSHKLSDSILFNTKNYQTKTHQLTNSSTQPPINSLTNQLINKLTLYLPPRPQSKSIPPFARLVKKDETFVDWRLVETAMKGESPDDQIFSPLLAELPSKCLTAQEWAKALERMIRAFYGWPGVWTEVVTDKGVKRLKLHNAEILNGKLVLGKVQIEGKQIEKFSIVRELIKGKY